MKALQDGHHGYTPATGILPLREAVARDLDRRLSQAWLGCLPGAVATFRIATPGGRIAHDVLSRRVAVWLDEARPRRALRHP